jgi:ADP-ribose pyrophosphatase YjhB (NUDIX family)
VRHYPGQPIVSVGAVVLDRGDRVLLVKRGQAPLKGEWSLPGGVVEVGETLADALTREVLEETGIEIEVGPVLEVLDRIHRSEDDRIEYHYVIVDYLCRPRGGRAVSGSDADEVRWVGASDLALFSVSPPVGAVVRKGLELAGRSF